MRWLDSAFVVLAPILVLGLGANARAGPAMFQVSFSASFIMHYGGSDATTGSAFPSSIYTFSAVPLGYECYNYRRTTIGKVTPPRPRYCPLSVLHKGHPATGVGTLAEGSGATPSIPLQQSAFRVTTTGLLLGYSYGGFVSHTYATFVNAAGAFFAGGGPAASGMGNGQVTHVAPSPRLGSWIIRQGKHGFGGALGLLGRAGATWSSGFSHGVSSGTTSWNMIRALGRGAADPDHTFTNTGMFRAPFGKTGTFTKVATGTPWTTGSVTLYIKNDNVIGVFSSTMRRAGYDNRTSMGIGNIQLVTPSLTHWSRGFWNTGHIGILKLEIAPEPHAMLLLAAGVGVLMLLRRASRRG
jgi:hypothetical protein